MWNMWRIVCLLKKKCHTWSNNDLCDDFAVLMEKERIKDGKESNYQTFEESKKGARKYLSFLRESIRNESKVKRKKLIRSYVDKYYDENDKCPKCNFVAEANSIIQSCIDNKEKYIEVDKTNKDLIYITKEGKSFASADGLLKIIGEGLTDIIISWKWVVITIIGLIGALNNETVIVFVKGLLIK